MAGEEEGKGNGKRRRVRKEEREIGRVGGLGEKIVQWEEEAGEEEGKGNGKKRRVMKEEMEMGRCGG